MRRFSQIEYLTVPRGCDVMFHSHKSLGMKCGESQEIRRTKIRWTSDEDQILSEAVKEHGARDWNAIAKSLPGRNGKQCRERYLYKFSDDFKHNSWTEEEDTILTKMQRQFGNHWSKFAQMLPGRSVVAIKNRWASLQRRNCAPRTARLSALVDPILCNFDGGLFDSPSLDCIHWDIGDLSEGLFDF